MCGFRQADFREIRMIPLSSRTSNLHNSQIGIHTDARLRAVTWSVRGHVPLLYGIGADFSGIHR